MTDILSFTDAERVFVSKAEQFCAASEQCRTSVRDKLAKWGAGQDLTSRIVDYLTEHEFIDERRFCRLYCDSKLHLLKWGRQKIRYQLRLKQIDSTIIDEALAGIDEEQYRETLMSLAESKSRTLKEEDPHKRKAKLLSFLASHGFTPDEVGKLIIDN